MHLAGLICSTAQAPWLSPAAWRPAAAPGRRARSWRAAGSAPRRTAGRGSPGPPAARRACPRCRQPAAAAPVCQATVGFKVQCLGLAGCPGRRADTGQPDAAAQGRQQGGGPALAADSQQPQRLCAVQCQMLGYRVQLPGWPHAAAQGRQQGGGPALAANREQPQRLCANPLQMLGLWSRVQLPCWQPRAASRACPPCQLPAAAAPVCQAIADIRVYGASSRLLRHAR